MAKRNIVVKGDPALTRSCREVTAFSGRLAQLLDDMAETMYAAQGVGIAAPQVAVSRRLFVVDVSEDKKGLIEFVNPEILESSGEQGAFEGCLSCPDDDGYVVRAMNVKIKAQNRRGEWFVTDVEGYLARAIQHEYDHLDGILFIDRATEPPAEALEEADKEPEDE